MKIFVFILTSFLLIDANSMKLEDALAKAYQYNPKLKAQQEDLKKTDEQIMQALSGFLPNVSILRQGKRSRTKNYTAYTGAPASYNDKTEFTSNITVRQNIFRSFGDVANISTAKSIIKSARANLTLVEQAVLLEAIKSYLEVVSASESLKIYENKVKSYRKLVNSLKIKFKAGEVTKTDVAQSEAQYSQSISDRITALGELESAKAKFKAIIGESPENLTMPRIKFAIPHSRDEAIRLAESNNPNIFIAKYSKKSAEHAINAARANLLPSADMQFSRTKTAQENAKQQLSNTTTFSVAVPLFAGGKNWSSLRSAKREAASKKYAFRNVQNEVYGNIIRAWQDFEVSKASLRAREDALESSKIAWEGIQIEEKAGTRDIVDVIVVQNNYFDNNIRWVNEKVRYYATYYALKSVLGELTARHLGLKVDYFNPLENYNKISKQFIGAY